jgi:hypothetical protein
LKKASLDPFYFDHICEDVQPFILQHFTGKDFLNMTEVSTTWDKQFECKLAEETRVNAMKMLKSLKIRKESPRFKEVFVKLDDENTINAATTFAKTVEKLTINANDNSWCFRSRKITRFPQLKFLNLQIDSMDTLLGQCQ